MLRSAKTLLCIDDHQEALSGWCLYLQSLGFQVMTAPTPEEGLTIFGTNAVDAVILDYSMPEMNGSAVADAMKRVKPEVPVLMFTAVTHLPASARGSVDAFVVKGQHPSVLVKEINRLLHTGDITKEAAS